MSNQYCGLDFKVLAALYTMSLGSYLDSTAIVIEKSW